MAHHFHNENGHYGVVNFVWDRFPGTFRAEIKAMPKSATAFNLGHGEDEAALCPWVAELTGTAPAQQAPRGR